MGGKEPPCLGLVLRPSLMLSLKVSLSFGKFCLESRSSFYLSGFPARKWHVHNTEYRPQHARLRQTARYQRVYVLLPCQGCSCSTSYRLQASPVLTVKYADVNKRVVRRSFSRRKVVQAARVCDQCFESVSALLSQVFASSAATGLVPCRLSCLVQPESRNTKSLASATGKGEGSG